MKRLLLPLVISLLGGAGCDATRPSDSAPAVEASARTLGVSLRADKASYVPGELVSLTAAIANVSPSPVELPRGINVQEGALKILIAFEDGPYRVYLGPGWGLRSVFHKGAHPLGPGESFTTSATLLHNRTLATEHLNEDAARELRERERRVEHAYALERPGLYRLKAVVSEPSTGLTLESAPLEIRVEAPSGDDLAVWEAMRADPAYGFFVQTGAPPAARSDDERARMVDALQALVEAHPRSRHAQILQKAAEGGRAAVEARRRKRAARRP